MTETGSDRDETNSPYIMFVLRDKEVVGTRDPLEFAAFMQDFNNRKVGRDTGDGWIISTVFLGVECGLGGYFETMEMSSVRLLDRYNNWEAAMIGHAECVNAQKQRNKEDNDRG